MSHCAHAQVLPKKRKKMQISVSVRMRRILKKEKKDADKSSILKREKDAVAGQERNIL